MSFTVKPGELKIVTGASGCGKTTLMRLTNGLAPQVYGGTVTGSVTVAGKNVLETGLPNSPKTSEPFFRIRKSSFSR
ncbi:MAG: ATP-binding cassette domain-containing protein [Duodenibacillus massiliensis]